MSGEVEVRQGGVAPNGAGVIAQQFDQRGAQKIELRFDPVQVALHRDDVIVLMPGGCSHRFISKIAVSLSANLNMKAILQPARDPHH
jgi:hypothetical protein